mmetsp:Transcript_34694/g.67150  ORF Transcript_34694/g.67150 Transcript_34694/m.67150 type:complete len:129 (+) Transcript_34694:126-512(+)
MGGVSCADVNLDYDRRCFCCCCCSSSICGSMLLLYNFLLQWVVMTMTHGCNESINRIEHIQQMILIMDSPFYGGLLLVLLLLLMPRFDGIRGILGVLMWMLFLARWVDSKVRGFDDVDNASLLSAECS